MINYQQQTSLLIQLISFVKNSLAQEHALDSVFAGRIAEYVEKAERHGIATRDKESDVLVDDQILTLCGKLVDSHPQSAAVLLKQIAHRQMLEWTFRQPLYSIYHNLMNKVPTTPVIADSLLAFMDAEIASPLRVSRANRYEAMQFLMVKGHEALLNTKSVETAKAMPRFIELAAISFDQQDHVGTGLSSGIRKILKSSTFLDEVEDVQQTIDETLDPLLRLLCACAPHASIFGPSLEDMLFDMARLKEMHQSLLVHAVRPLLGDVVNPQKISQLILSALTLEASRLTSEMNLPQQSGSYPFGWHQSANFEKHPVVENLNTLIPWLNKVTSEDAQIASNHELLMTRAKKNLVACLANWCGHEARPGTISTNTAVSKVIIDSVFDKSYLEDALKGVDEKGRPILAQYVVENHKALGKLLPRVAKGEYLSDSLGL